MGTAVSLWVGEGSGGVVVADGDDDVVVVGVGLDVVADEPVLTSRAGGVLDSRDPSRRLVDEGVSTMRVTAPFAGTGQAAVSTTTVTRCPALTGPDRPQTV